MCAGARAGATEGAEEAGGERQAEAGVRPARQHLPPVAAGDQVRDGGRESTAARVKIS